jgi:hypothetical protein
MRDIVHRAFPHEQLHEISTTVRQILSQFSVGVGGKPSPDSVLAPKHARHLLELHNEGLRLSKLFEEALTNPSIPSEAPIPFPKTLTPFYLDSRYSIFRMQKMRVLSPYDSIYAIPPIISCEICVVKRDETYFLGLIGHEINPEIYRVFEMSKEFDFTICCLHDISLFPC